MTVLAAPPISVADEQQQKLDRTARSSSSPHRSLVRAKAMLLVAYGVAIHEIARPLHVAANSVRTWRGRFEAAGVDGVDQISPGLGRKSWLPEGTVAAVVHDAVHTSPDGGSTNLSARLRPNG